MLNGLFRNWSNRPNFGKGTVFGHSIFLSMRKLRPLEILSLHGRDSQVFYNFAFFAVVCVDFPNVYKLYSSFLSLLAIVNNFCDLRTKVGRSQNSLSLLTNYRLGNITMTNLE